MIKTNWVVDFKGMSFHLGLFYAYRLGNHIYVTSIFTFLYSCFLSFFFVHRPTE